MVQYISVIAIHHLESLFPAAYAIFDIFRRIEYLFIQPAKLFENLCAHQPTRGHEIPYRYASSTLLGRYLLELLPATLYGLDGEHLAKFFLQCRNRSARYLICAISIMQTWSDNTILRSIFNRCHKAFESSFIYFCIRIENANKLCIRMAFY